MGDDDGTYWLELHDALQQLTYSIKLQSFKKERYRVEDPKLARSLLKRLELLRREVRRACGAECAYRPCSLVNNFNFRDFTPCALFNSFNRNCLGCLERCAGRVFD